MKLSQDPVNTLNEGERATKRGPSKERVRGKERAIVKRGLKIRPPCKLEEKIGVVKMGPEFPGKTFDHPPRGLHENS